jgi:uncharacterized SAM-binding protein YcdF (DUF218 family)
MTTLLKASLPGSIAFLAIAFAFGLILLPRQRARRWARRWLWGLLAAYLVFSIPVTARWLAAPLAWGITPIESSAIASEARAVVVLDGGTARFLHREELIEIPLDTSALRALEACRVYRLMNDPLVIVSGGDEHADPKWAREASALSEVLIKGGVPEARIVLDSDSVNTRAHSVNVVHMLKERKIGQFVLVTSPSHMRRAIWTFQAQGVNPLPSPSKSIMDSRRGSLAYWPSTRALEFTQETMHEYVGLVYYLIKGYI